MVCRWAVVWTGSPDAAEDVAQAVLLRVDGSLASFVPEGRIITWVYRITKNVLVDRDRSRGRDQAIRDRVRLEEVARAAVVADGAHAFEAADLLQHLMVALSPQQRAVLDLVELQGFSAQEAAEMLEVAPTTIRVHLHRARRVLRARVEGEETVGDANGQ
jgi:RNA polymerase sigma-70 factor (ECF subfamily)